MIVITCTGFPTCILYFDGCNNFCNSSKSNNIFIPIYFYILTYLSKFNFIDPKDKKFFNELILKIF